MKAVINEKETPVQERKYPWIGKVEIRGRVTIIMFVTDIKGVCLSTDPGSNNYVGEIGTEWNINLFTPFTGSITLSND